MKTQIVKDGNNKAYIITEVKNHGSNFDLSFRTYSLDGEVGGFLSTYRISGISIDLINMFCAPEYEVKRLVEMFGGKLISKKTNNIVPEKFQFNSVKHLLN